MKPNVRRLAIAVLLVVGLIPWLIAIPCLWLCVRIAVLARGLTGDANYGNCWTYALPRWAEHGGWLMIRWSEDERLFGWLRIPHAVWLRRLPAEGVHLESFSPTELVPSRWLPWQVLWFRGQVKTTEDHTRHNVSGPP